uniref:Diadenosine tetraphosphate (Ap4A) hydrolase n=1 Tax=Candidatus Kentrum sp. LFY TaxID=2126342 RepID=A0A450WGA0_9GAMM|nr:MAG: Diadenosine tetraphosphate (Ap4A) hydrolase [Candidatus Kentron sp. LFY]
MSNSAEICPFCNGFLGVESVIGIPINKLIVIKTENFVVVPDCAPLMEGHFLIVSKEHYPCFGAMPPELLLEAVTIKREIRHKLTSAYCAPVFFEHGPVVCDTAIAGSCVDHAHLHCLPVGKEFSSLIMPSREPEELTEFWKLAEYTRNGLSYLFYESREGDMDIYPLDAENDDVPPQHLRHAAARILSMPNWNWRDISKKPDYGDVVRTRILRAVEEMLMVDPIDKLGWISV